jgi:SAM-dependent methyltransferase
VTQAASGATAVQKELKDYTPQDVLAMNYNELIGLVRETNRPPGGANAIFRIAQRAFLRPNSKVLEIGTSTGFTAVELARLVGCHIDAIDINPVSIEEAAGRAKLAGVRECIDFKVEDATKTAFGDRSFDMVFCGNVTSLIPDRERALAEYSRVLKDGGVVAAIPMYYMEKPPADLVRRVSDAIRVDIIPRYKKDWVEFFDRKPLELYWSEDYRFDRIGDEAVGRFVDEILKRPHLDSLRSDTRSALSEQYRRFMYLFRENLAIMGYTLMLLRKETCPIDPELFTSSRVKA